MMTRISITKCKRQLATVWFVGSAAIFLVVFLQTIFGRYSAKATDAWGWFLPTVIPTLSLMIGVFVADTMRDIHDKVIDPFVYRLAFILSITYFAVVLATIALQPFADVQPLELLKMSNLWLAPLQGLVTGILGVFFVKAEQIK
jgi:hypothetical protein